MVAQPRSSILVDHRGDRNGGVENTLPAFIHAAGAGARFAECDVQLTTDLIPVVLHDNHLKRICRRPDLCVSDHKLATLASACSHHLHLLSMADLLQRLSAVEIAELLTGLLPSAPMHQLVLISEDGDIIDACHTRLDCRTGWVAEGCRQPTCPTDYYSRMADAYEHA